VRFSRESASASNCFGKYVVEMCYCVGWGVAQDEGDMQHVSTASASCLIALNTSCMTIKKQPYSTALQRLMGQFFKCRVTLPFMCCLFAFCFHKALQIMQVPKVNKTDERIVLVSQ
jgi:hypothetical protein